MELMDGARIAVVGGGPAGSLTSYFILQAAAYVDLQLQIDIYEPKDYTKRGPAGCNQCGGIVSESLVQLLAAEGINLPDSVVQRGVDTYFLHTDEDDVRISAALSEMRVAAMHRGAGPKQSTGDWRSFDGYLLELAQGLGANHIRDRVRAVEWQDGRPAMRLQSGLTEPYDLVVGAVGINSVGIKMFEDQPGNYQPPVTTKAGISEIYYGREELERLLGTAVHVFLLDMPRVEFAAIVPKGDYGTVCLMGHDIDQELLQQFLNHPQVRKCLPEAAEAEGWACRCAPKLNVGAPQQYYSDRFVMVGDCGVTRLYKDGIGAAYRAAKACAATVVYHGVAAEDFERFFEPTCKRIRRDNWVGGWIFASVTLLQKLPFLRRAVVGMAWREQQPGGPPVRMCSVLWDTFTGSAPYADVLRRGMKPGFICRYLIEMLRALATRSSSSRAIETVNV